MKIVIKIPEEEYNECKKQVEMMKEEGIIIESLNTALRIIVANGTPLPKGHGRLKDMGNLQYVFDLTREDPLYSGKDIERAIKSMTTIIGADTESEDYE